MTLGLCGPTNREFTTIPLGSCNNSKPFVEEKNKLIGRWKAITTLKKGKVQLNNVLFQVPQRRNEG